MYKRKEVIGTCTLYLGDCLEVMQGIDNVDAVVTDPPYELSNNRAGKSNISSLDKFNKDDLFKIVDGFNYEVFFENVIGKCQPFNMFCFCSNKQISKIMSISESNKFSTTLLVWHKTNSAPFANGVWRGDIEYCIHSRQKGATFNGNAEQKQKVTSLPAVVDSRHPTVKPLVLIEKYIKICSNEADTILDPFMGSGTTGVACAKLGRKFIGIELDEEYFEIACERIRQAYAQPDLFVAQPVEELKQEILI